MKLNEIADNPGARKKRTRIGRGIGSGKGKTGGRGGKGQTARSGVRIKGFEGGQMPLHRRLPKRGFRNTPFALKLNEINLGRVQAAIDAGKLDAKAPSTCGRLVKAGLLRRAQGRREAAWHRRAQGQGRISVWRRLEVGRRGGREGRRLRENPGAAEKKTAGDTARPDAKARRRRSRLAPIRQPGDARFGAAGTV